MRKIFKSFLFICLAIILSSAFLFAYNPPNYLHTFYGDATGDMLLQVDDIPTHKQYAASGAASYNTTQPQTSSQYWNTCDMTGDNLCQVDDIPSLKQVAAGNTISIVLASWEIVNWDLPLTGNTSGPTFIPFRLNARATGGTVVGRPGIIMKVTIDPIGSTTTGLLQGRSCSSGDLHESGATCAIAVSVTDMADPNNSVGLTESASSITLAVQADGAGTLHLHVETVAQPFLNIPAMMLDIYPTFGCGGGCGLSIDCSSPGPNPVDELTAMQCTVAAPSAPEVDTANDTCGGSISGSGPWTYDFTPTEAQGPGTCSAAFELASNTAVKDSGEVTINEVNVAPQNNAPSSVSGNALIPISFGTSPTDPDIPTQTLISSVVGATDDCAEGSFGTGANANVWSWTPTESQAQTSCDVVTRVYDGKGYSSLKITHVIIDEPLPAEVDIDCSNPGPNPVGELTSMQCTVIATGGAPVIDTGVDTCGGLISGSGPWTYDFTPTEAQGPGTCVAAVMNSANYGQKSGGNIRVNEVNVAPVNNAPVSVSGYETTPISFGTSPTDPDIPTQTLTSIVIGATGACTNGSFGTGTGANVWSWTPPESPGPTSCYVTSAVYDGMTSALAKTTHVIVNKVNSEPTWSSAPTDISIVINNNYDQVNGYAVDSDMPAQTVSCAKESQTCGFTVNVSGSGNGGAYCNISFAAPDAATSCYVNIEASDSAGGSVSNNIKITINPVPSLTAVSAGHYHTCALTSTGGVKCWGNNNYGQLGNNSSVQQSLTPVDVSGLTSGVTKATNGRSHTCALTAAGGVKCWGYNSDGQLGDNSTTNRLTPVDVSGLTSGATAIAAGAAHTCAVTSAGGVKCWGNNQFGQLGDNSTTDRLTPVDVSGLTSGVTAIAAGAAHTCALTTGGGVKCWGWNWEGEVGNGTSDLLYPYYLTPVDVSGLTSGVAAIAAASGNHTCALTSAGAVKCWGYNGYGQLGDNSTSDRNSPVNVSGLTSGVTAIAAGEYHTCAVKSAGAKCWGYNNIGQVGDNSTTNRLTPVDVSGLTSGVTVIAAGGAHTCSLTSSGAVKCWGSNSYGQLGSNEPVEYYLTPASVSGLTSGMTAITTGNAHGCAISSIGGLNCWGINTNGQLGDNSTTTRWTPVGVYGLASGVASASAANGSFSCAVTSSGGAKCWGYNGNQGQLGDNTSIQRLTPVDVFGLSSGVTAISAASASACALTSSGGVKCWGDNSYGVLGNNSTTTSWTPVDVYGLTSGVTAITTKLSHACAITSSGGAKCWGHNGQGQLGDNSTNDRWTPVDVYGLTSGVIAISAGDTFTCALTTGGGVKCWGYNYFGQVGDNSTTTRWTPVDVYGLTSGVIAISAGGSHACALTTGGAVKCWGYNLYGQLGDGTTTNRLAPTPVSGLSSGVTAISAGGSTCALTSGGGVKCWGLNDDGAVGTGQYWSLVPVDVLW